MRKVTIPDPPDANNFVGNPIGFNRAAQRWMSDVKLAIENSSKVNDIPLAVPFSVSGYTTNTTLTGTSTLTDVANFICTLVDAFVAQGRITNKS